MPDDQSQLSFGHYPITGERTEPRLWIKEFGFYTNFKTTAEHRRITLRKGLNIIWAKESIEGASGHAAGKSTFSRMLRYLLGDHSYGSDDFRTALLKKFPDGLLIGEVILQGESWLLCRSLLNKSGDWASKGVTYGQAFDDDLPKTDYKDFLAALHEAFITPLGIEHYPGTDKELLWQHLLPWLTRDQDARYSEALVWRGTGESHTTLKNEKVNLIRLALKLLDSEELTQQAEHSKLLKDKRDLRTEIPQLSYAIDRRLNELTQRFPKLQSLREGDLETSLDEQKKQANEDLERLRGKITAARKTDGIDEVLKATFEVKTTARNSAQSELNACETSIKRNQSELNYREGKLTEEEYKKQQSELTPVKGMCRESIESAIAAGCPLAPSEHRDELLAQRLEDAKGDVEAFKAAIQRDQAKKPRLQQELEEAVKQLQPIAAKIETLRAKHQKEIEGLHAKALQIEVKQVQLTSLLQDSIALREKKESQEKNDEAIDASNDTLRKLRKKSGPFLSKLTNDFNVVASHLTQQEINGKVEFESDAIKASMNYEGDQTSAALITLRLLAFDLAALLGSIRETSQHPGFLLHDSPREADLSVHIYRRLFTLIAGELEAPENEAVQYIIATTEAPPEHLQSKPWLSCAPLSSENPETRLLKTII